MNLLLFKIETAASGVATGPEGLKCILCQPMLPPSCYQDMSVFMRMNYEDLSLSQLQLHIPFIVVKVSKGIVSVHAVHST